MGTVKEKLSGVNALIEERDRVLAELRKRGKSVFHDALGAFFEEHPKVIAISWTQYTPYFNDGDPCVFGVHGPGYLVEGMHYGDDDKFEKLCGGELHEYWRYSQEEIGYLVESDEDNEFSDDVRGAYKEAAEDFDAIASFITSNEDLMEHVFGDHVRVECTRNGIDVDEFDHG